MTAGSNGRDAAGPLSGIRVLEFGSLLAGPLCARILGDFGADVIKVESPGAGDPLRQWGQEPFHGRDLLWTIYARNKRCITINLRQPEGQELARELARRSDILVENFRPGTLEKWGLGPDDLAAVNPDLIMVRVSGFGQTGPYSEKAGFGSVAEAMGGIRYLTGFPDRPPVRTGVSLGDSLAALFGVIGALLALCGRERKNGAHGARSGQVVDVAIYEAVYALMESLVPEYVLQGKVRQRTGAILPHVAPSNVYPCSDGVSVIIAGNADNVFRRLCDAMGQPELSGDPRFATHQARGEHQEEIDAIVSQWTMQHPSQEVVALMDEAGVPAGPIYTAREIVADPHFQARGMVVPMPIEEGIEFPMTGIVPILTGTPGAVRWAGSTESGSHNREVYSEVLGLADARIDDLAQRGII
jgi:crotonobetainyl-CoA:carnitine CoA-transferase CaiB-like acyl-CoA transferase